MRPSYWSGIEGDEETLQPGQQRSLEQQMEDVVDEFNVIHAKLTGRIRMALKLKDPAFAARLLARVSDVIR